MLPHAIDRDLGRAYSAPAMARYRNRLESAWWHLRRRFRPRIELTGRNYAIARRLLLDVVDACNSADVDYALEGGTLLGIVRDGDLIPWDKDVDLTLDSGSVERFKTQYPALRARGWRIADHYLMPSDTEAWRRGALRSIKIRNQKFGRFGRGRIVLDIFIRYRHADHHWWAHRGNVNRVAAEYFDQCGYLEFAGRTLRVPDAHERYLELMFGDWRTPDPQFNGSRFDGTIVGKLRQKQPREAS